MIYLYKNPIIKNKVKLNTLPPTKLQWAWHYKQMCFHYIFWISSVLVFPAQEKNIIIACVPSVNQIYYHICLIFLLVYFLKVRDLIILQEIFNVFWFAMIFFVHKLCLHFDEKGWFYFPQYLSDPVVVNGISLLYSLRPENVFTLSRLIFNVDGEVLNIL